MATQIKERLSAVEEAVVDLKSLVGIIIHEMRDDTRKLKENLDKQSREHSENMEKLRSEHNENMDRNDRKYSENIDRNDRKYSENMEILRRENDEYNRKQSENMEMLRNEHNENMEKLRKEHNENMDRISKEQAEGWLKYKKESNRIKGELSDRFGTLAEDFAAPNVPIIAEKYFGCPDEPNDIFLRRKKMHPVTGKKDKREYDVVAVYDDCVICTEIKYKAKSSDVEQFRRSLDVFFEYYPEYEKLRLIPLFGSLQLDDSIVNLCSKNGIYCMTLTVETMDIINYERVSL